MLSLVKGRRTTVVAALFLAAVTALFGCQKTENPTGTSGGQAVSFGGGVSEQMQQNAAYADYDGEPYAVRTILREYTVVDAASKTGAYGRYTELIVEGNAPETFRNAVAECNRRAEESVRSRTDRFSPEQVSSGSNSDGYRYVTYGYIAAVTRADHTAYSFLETEFESSGKNSSDVTYRFSGAAYDTASGEEISLADLVGDEETCSERLREALSERYGIEDLASTVPGDYAWAADALGVRFYFHADAVSAEKQRELKNYSARAVTVGIPYTGLPGEKAAALSSAPESYIAMPDPGTEYDLPYGDMEILWTEQEGTPVIRIQKDSGEESELEIEYGDSQSDYYIIRAEEGFYLFRERIGREEGFFYNFSKPDGGFGRFAYNTAQYFDSFLREIQLAVPYNPYCVHMAEVRRSFGEKSYDSASFVPHGHYKFPSDPGSSYKRFFLTDGSLQMDTYNTACRLLEDFTATQIDAEGKEAGEITVPAGKTLFFETVTGEAPRYDDPPKRSYHRSFYYDCRLTDGTKIRFASNTESTVSAEAGFLNRFTEPITLGEAQFESGAAPAEPFTVQIAGKDYPLISDYSRPNHTGEEIDFGEDVWWLVEGYPGRYSSTDEDKKDMEDGWFTQDALAHPEESAELTISEDGKAVFDFFGEVFEGWLPKKRYYKSNVEVFMTSDRETRTFMIILREGEKHTAPTRIEFYSEGLPATNEPSKVPSISVYMTRE